VTTFTTQVPGYAGSPQYRDGRFHNPIRGSAENQKEERTLRPNYMLELENPMNTTRRSIPAVMSLRPTSLANLLEIMQTAHFLCPARSQGGLHPQPLAA